MLNHEYGPRRERCRTALLVAGEGGTSMTDLLAAAWADFGAQVTLLERPTAQQLQQRMQDMQNFAAENPWVEAACFYFAGRGCETVQDDKKLQLLEVFEQAPAAAAAAGEDDSATDGLPRVLVAPLEGLEAGVQAAQVPLLVQIDTVPSDSSSVAPTQQQLDDFRSKLRDRCAFSHRVYAMDCADDGALLTWSWLMFKHTFLVYHSSWAAAHAAAAAELAAAGVEAPVPCFASDESNTALFPHGQVAEQHHRVLKLLHDVTSAAHTAPRSNHTLHLLTQLSLLLADDSWRPFVLRWGLLRLTAVEADDDSAATAGGGGGNKTKQEQTRLDELMRGLSELFLQEVKLPGALLQLAATDRPETQQAAAAVMRHLSPLTNYGVMPGEPSDAPDAAGRKALAKQLLEVKVKPTATAEPLPLCLLPFVAAFLVCEGLEAELKEAVAGCDLIGLDDLYTPAAFAGAVEALTASTTHPPWSSSAADALSMPPPHKRPRLTDNTPASPYSMLPPNTPGGNSSGGALAGPGTFSNGSLQGQAAERVATWQELLAARNTVIGAAGSPQLDPNIQQVTAKTLIDVAPLLQLQQLRKLRLTGCSCSGDTLLRLTAVQSLQELELSFERPSDAMLTSRAWPRLPVSSISFGGASKSKYSSSATLTVMHGLAQLTALTAVRFDCRMEHLTPLNLGTTLTPLTSLARISISNIHLGRKYGSTSTAGWTQLVRAFASLPRLASLNIFWLDGGFASVAHHLSAITSTCLTSLHLTSCGIKDEAAISIIRGPNLRGLHALDLADGASITDATMAEVAKHLTALTYLRVGKGVTPAGRQVVISTNPSVRITI